MMPTRSFASVWPRASIASATRPPTTTPSTPTVIVSVPNVMPARAAVQPYVRIDVRRQPRRRREVHEREQRVPEVVAQ